MAQFTDITVLVDRSGSMEAIKAAMESAFDEFVREHRAVPSSRLTLIQFDSKDPQEVVFRAKPIAEAGRLVIEPRSMTPLLDALGTAIDATGERLKGMSDADRPDQVLFVVITDGLENASREFDRAAVRKRIEQQSSVYKWQFVYLGANQNAIAEAAKLGIPVEDALDYAAVPDNAMAAMRAFSENSVKYASRTATHAGSFTSAQRSASVRPKDSQR